MISFENSFIENHYKVTLDKKKHFVFNLNIKQIIYCEVKNLTIKDLEKKYRDEWVLVEILKEDELGQPTDVKLLAHSKSRDEIYAKLRETKSTYVSTFYTGNIPQKGYAVALNVKV